MLSKCNEYVKNHSYAAGAVLALVAAVVFSGVLSNGFVYDDGVLLLDNPFVRNPHLWRRVFRLRMVVSWGRGGNELLPPSGHFFFLDDLACRRI